MPFQRCTGFADDGHRALVEVEEDGGDEVVLDIGDEPAEGAQYAGGGRDHDMRDAEFPGEEAREHRPCAPERLHREVTDVDPVA